PRRLAPFPTRRSSDLPVLVDHVATVERWKGTLFAIGALAEPAVNADQGIGGGRIEIPAIGIDEPARVADLASDGDGIRRGGGARSEEHTSELQSRENL